MRTRMRATGLAYLAFSIVRHPWRPRAVLRQVYAFSRVSVAGDAYRRVVYAQAPHDRPQIRSTSLVKSPIMRQYGLGR